MGERIVPLKRILSWLICSFGVVSCLPDREKQPPNHGATPPTTAEADTRSSEDHTETLQEIARVGDVSGSPVSELGQITAITVDSLARVYVADPLSKEVRVFDLRGGYVRTLGRRGHGPGEFWWPLGFVWENGLRLWIHDYSQRRYSIYDTTGTHVADRPRGRLGITHPWPAQFWNGTLLEVMVGANQYSLVAVDPTRTNALPQDTFRYPLYDYPPPEQWVPGIFKSRGVTTWRLKAPFLEGVKWAFDGEGGLWVGDTRRYEILHKTIHGKVIGSVRNPVLPVLINNEEKAAALRFAEGASTYTVPQTKPAFRYILPRVGGELIIFREGPGPIWLVDYWQADGTLLYSRRLPVQPDLSVAPVSLGKTLWVVVRGPEDTPRVVWFSLGN